MLSAWFTGLFTGLGLIIAIGAQNAFVLRQGIKREHVLPLVLICAVTDAVLQLLGVAGIGFVVQRAPVVLEVVRWAGVAFLTWYGIEAFRRARRPGQLIAGGGPPLSLKRAVLTCLAITYLNPHVYLDTMVLMGSIGATQGNIGRWWFVVGGAIASLVWFFSLGYGARLLRPIFAKPVSWRILDVLVGLTMWSIAAKLVFESLVQ